MLIINIDGASRGNPGPAGIGIVIIKDNLRLAEYKEFIGKKTNNQAEYNWVILAYEFLHGLEELPTEINFFLDSELITNQITGRFKVKDSKLQDLVSKVKKLEQSLNTKITYKHIPRALNKLADAMVNKTIDAALEN